MAFVTLEEAMSHLKIDEGDDRVPELIGFLAAAIEVVEGIVGPVDAAEHTEWHDGGGPVIVLRHAPVVEVESVTEYPGGTTTTVLAAQPAGGSYTSDGYTLDAGTGVVTKRTGSGAPTRFAAGAQVKVVYTAGRATVPPAARLAVLQMVQDTFLPSQEGDPGFAPGGFGSFRRSLVVSQDVIDTLTNLRRASSVA